MGCVSTKKNRAKHSNQLSENFSNQKSHIQSGAPSPKISEINRLKACTPDEIQRFVTERREQQQYLSQQRIQIPQYTPSSYRPKKMIYKYRENKSTPHHQNNQTYTPLAIRYRCQQ